MVGAQDVRLRAASQSRPQGGGYAADLTWVSVVPFQPKVCFTVQLKLQMMRHSSTARLVPRTASGAIASPVRQPARSNFNRKPLFGVLSEFTFLRSEHLARPC